MTSMEGPEYGRPGNTWSSNADQLYNQQHSIDPSTGAITGPAGAVPAGVAENWQAAHEQAVYNARQNWMSAGITAQQSALGALQSFRPGGLAALESNVYGQLGNAYFQRASLTQPMDLTSDLVRDAAARAREQANRAGEFRTIAGLTLGAASIAAPLIGGAMMGGPSANPGPGSGAATAGLGMAPGGMGAAFGPGGGASSNGWAGALTAGANFAGSVGGALLSGQGGPQAQAQPGAAPGGMPQAQGSGPFSSLGAAPAAGGVAGAGYGASQPAGPGGMPPPSVGMPGTPGPSGGGAPSSAQAQLGGGGGPGPANVAGGTEGASGGGAAAGGAPAGPVGAGGKPRVGANGDFTPLSYAMAASGNPSPSMDAIQTVVARDLAKIVDADPDWRFMDTMFSKQIQARSNYGYFRNAGYGEEASARMAALSRPSGLSWRVER